MINIIHQLSDLSRNASDIFLGIEMEAGMVFQRSRRIQQRLETLQNTVCKFDHKKIKIRKYNQNNNVSNYQQTMSLFGYFLAAQSNIVAAPNQ